MPCVNIDYYTRKPYERLEPDQDLKKDVFLRRLRTVISEIINLYPKELYHDELPYFDSSVEFPKMEREIIELLNQDDIIFRASLYNYIWSFAKKAIDVATKRKYFNVALSVSLPNPEAGSTWKVGDKIPRDWANVYNILCDCNANKRIERDYELEGYYSYTDRWGWEYRWAGSGSNWVKIQYEPNAGHTLAEPYTYVQITFPDGSQAIRLRLQDGSLVDYDFFRRPNRPIKPWAPYNNG